MSPDDPTSKQLEAEASHQAYIQNLLEELAQKDRLVAEMRVELEQLRNGTKTWPPPRAHDDDPDFDHPNEDTGDLKKCHGEKGGAILQELQFIRQGFATMNSELGGLHREHAEWRPLVQQVIEFLQAGCCDHCPHRVKPPPPAAPPPGHTSLSVVPKVAAGGD